MFELALAVTSLALSASFLCNRFSSLCRFHTRDSALSRLIVSFLPWGSGWWLIFTQNVCNFWKKFTIQ